MKCLTKNVEPWLAGGADLTDGTLRNPINITETGGNASSDVLANGFPGIWTNVSSDGTTGPADRNCADWSAAADSTGTVALAGAVDATWTETNFGAGCSNDARELPFMCFQQ